MRITDVKTFIPMVGNRPSAWSRSRPTRASWAGANPGCPARERAVAAAVGHYREFLIGADPMARGAIWQRLYRSQYFEGGRVLTAAHVGHRHRALRHQRARRSGVPVYQLLGGKQRDFVPLFATTPARRWDRRSSRTPSGSSARAGTSIRLFPDAMPPTSATIQTCSSRATSLALTADWLRRKLREAVGPAAGPRASTTTTACRSPRPPSFCQRMPPGTLDFLEEPIRAENPDAYAAAPHADSTCRSRSARSSPASGRSCPSSSAA